MIRNKFLTLRKNFDVEEKIFSDFKIFENLKKSNLYKNSQNIFIFISFNDEIQTHDFICDAINQGKKVYVPYIRKKNSEILPTRLRDFKNDLIQGYSGILTVKENKLKFCDKNDLDLIVTPGLVFDNNGYRIGYGGGYFDKFFSDLNSNVFKLGICYDFQIIESLPIEGFDIPVDAILTPSGFIDIAGKNL